MIQPKKLSDDDLYELLFQSGIKEADIPKKRKDRIVKYRKETACNAENASSQ